MATSPFEYVVGADRLSLSCNPELGNFSLLIEVKSVETSPGVLKNFYEDKSVVTSVRFANATLVWDDNYKQRQKACDDALEGVNRKHIPQRRARVPKPDDPFRLRGVEALINQLADASFDFGLGVATAAVEAVTRVANVVKGEVSKRR